MKSNKQNFKTNIPTYFTDPVIYNVIVAKAFEFAESLSGDLAYENSEVQTVAIENRVIGWMSTQQWFSEYRIYLEKNFSRDDIWTHASDIAMQAVADVVYNRIALQFKSLFSQ